MGCVLDRVLAGVHPCSETELLSPTASFFFSFFWASLLVVGKRIIYALISSSLIDGKSKSIS